MAAHFAKRNTKFGGGGKRGRAKIPSPPNPLPFCPPERSVWRAKRAVSSVQKRFGFRQTNAQIKRLVRGFIRPHAPSDDGASPVEDTGQSLV